MDQVIEFPEWVEPPKRHTLVRLGPFAFYWIWINPKTDHQHRCWILIWHTRRRLIHLSHWEWWRPITMFPCALRASIQTTNRAKS